MVPNNSTIQSHVVDWRDHLFDTSRDKGSTSERDTVSRQIPSLTMIPWKRKKNGSYRGSAGISLSTPVTRTKGFIYYALFILSFIQIGVAQDFINHGTINNRGTLKIKNKAIGLPASLTGTFELIGADQTLTAGQYKHVTLSGTGTKSATGGDLSITGNLTIAPAVTLQIPKGNIITLGDTLFESGVLQGAIQKSVNLTGSTTSSNFGNIGATITWNSNAPGITSVLRASDSTQSGNGNQSIKRYYQIQPTDATATGTVEFKFTDSELNGHDIHHLQLWRSIDNGNNWVRQTPVVDTLLRTISKTNVTLSGRWAMADTLRAIGPLQGAVGIPVVIAEASAQNAAPIILTTMDTIKVLITDAYGTPVSNVQVKFAINLRPSPDTLGRLSDTLVVTDASGYATTLFTVGSKVGQYRVIAAAQNLDTIKFYVNAQNGAAKSIASLPVTSENKAILTALDSLFTITVADTGGNPVDSAQVQFAIINPPAGSFGEGLSNQSAQTDSLGRASTRLTLGSKADTYIVRGTVAGVADTITFSATAKFGAPNQLAALILPQQSRPILTQLDTAFTITVSDTGGNAVNGAQVQFAIYDRPDGSVGDTLSVTTTTTNAQGKASTQLTLGSKLGDYKVSAKAIGVKDTVTFTASAKSGTPKHLAAITITPQTKPISTPLDTAFTVTVSDTAGNPVEGTQVHFFFGDVPTDALDTLLSNTMVSTNSLGQASTILTVGSKVGPYQVKSVVAGVTDTITFTANAKAGAPDVIAFGGGDNQFGENGKPLAEPYIVTILDKGGNPVPKDTVVFSIQTIPSNGATLSSTEVETDPLGKASTILTLGTKVGEYNVVAYSKTLGSSNQLPFKATATPGAAATLVEVSGKEQSAMITTQLSSDFVVRVRDANGNIAKPTTVTFSIDTLPNPSSIGQTLSTFSVLTNDSGLASTRLTLGNKSGDYVVNAKVNDSVLVSFKANAKPGAAVAVAETAGNNQSAQIITELQSDFVMRLVDIGGNNVSGQPVNFIITQTPTNSTGERLSEKSTNSDVNGFARVKFTLGNKVGPYKIKATSVGVPDMEFTAFATHGAAVAMIATEGLNQTKPILTPLDSFKVRVVDIGDNAVPLKNVQFVLMDKPAGDTSATLSTSTDGSDSSGIAVTQLTLGSKVGFYRVKALITSLAVTEAQEIGGLGKNNKKAKKPDYETVTFAALETTFTAEATQGAAASLVNISGAVQINPTSTTLDTAFTLTVKDIGGNLVKKTPVKFAVTKAPENAIGQSVKDTLILTDSVGTASTYFTLGDREGTYNVTASVGSNLSALYEASGYYIYGDPNGDINVNVADITTIIDQIIGNKTFSVSDSIKSDLDRSGRIDTSDIHILRDNILGKSLSFSTPPPFIPEQTATDRLSKKDGQTGSAKPRDYFEGAKTQFEVTPQGLRLNMENTVGVRGIEVRIRLKDSTVNVTKANYVFSRAQHMDVIVKTTDNEIRMLAYSLINSEIQPGEGTILRIPKITSTGQIDTTEVILAIASNVAVTPEAVVLSSTPGKYPLTYKLEQNYPNPFNGLTTIQYEIPDNRTTEAKTAIQIFNVLGQRVKTLISAPHDPGQYRITWNGTDDNGTQVASGIYFYRLLTKTHLSTKKMIYIK